MNRAMFSDADLERFWLKVRKTSGGCWYWQGVPDVDGYGVFKIRRCIDTTNGQTFKAHRISFFLHHGTIDSNLTLDHLCGNRICVRPDHLEQISAVKNTLRGGNAAKTHCWRGHPFSGENLIIDPKDGHRGCRECRNAYKASWIRNPEKPYQARCKYGHELTERTAYTARNGVRYCRVCKRLRHGGGKTMFIEEIFS